MPLLNKICYAICLICVVSGLVTGLIMIWSEQPLETAGKWLGTFAVLLLSSAITLSLNKMVNKNDD